MDRRILLSGFTILVVACILLVMVSLPGIFVFAGVNSLSATSHPFLACPKIITNPDDKDNLPAPISNQMDDIQKQVILIRGLCPKAIILRALLSRDELQKKVENDFMKQYTHQNAKDQVSTLAALGLLDQNFDLYTLYIKLYSEQVAGYYDDQAKEMYVINDTNFGGTERMTYSHEFTHTLQDQNYDLRGKMNLNDEFCKINSERCSAATALVEGDATMTEQDWFLNNGSATDKEQVQDFALSYKSPVLDNAPQFLREDFLFPYRQGYEMVQTIFDQGGWQAVNMMFSKPPVSTEQVLHPARYPWDKPVNVTLPDLSGVIGSGWRKLDQEVLGEWYTFLTLAYGKNEKFHLPIDEARQASTGWAGDQYAIYQEASTNKLLFLYRSKWDSNKDADEFWKALQDYGKARWGNPQEGINHSLQWYTDVEGQVIFKRNSQDILWLMAPTSEVAEKIFGLFSEFQY